MDTALRYCIRCAWTHGDGSGKTPTAIPATEGLVECVTTAEVGGSLRPGRLTRAGNQWVITEKVAYDRLESRNPVQPLFNARFPENQPGVPPTASNASDAIHIEWYFPSLETTPCRRSV